MQPPWSNTGLVARKGAKRPLHLPQRRRWWSRIQVAVPETMTFLHCVFPNAPATDKKKVLGWGVSGSSHEVALLLLLRLSLLLPPPRWRKKPPTQLLTNGGRVISWLLLPNLSVDIYLLLQPVGRKLGCEGSLGRSTALILSQEMTLTGTLSTEV